MVPSKPKLVLYGLVIAVCCLFALPNLFRPEQLASWPDWLPKKQVPLGLDLRGGAHLVLEIDGQALFQDQLDELARSADALLDGAAIEHAQPVLVNDQVLVRLPATTQSGTARTVLAAGLTGDEITSATDGTLILEPGKQALEARRRGAVEQSVEIVRRRIDSIGVAEPTVQSLGTQRVLVQLPGVEDPAAIRALLGSTAKLTFHRVRSVVTDTQRTTTAGTMRVPDAKDGSIYLVDRMPIVQGDRLIQARSDVDQRTGQPVVSFRFDAQGTKQFAEATTRLVGQPFAMVLDGKVLSAPVIQEPIVAGSGQIEGRFTTAETQSLAALLRAGSLPVPLKVVEERTVGPDLGADAIRTGATTGMIGLLLVLGFMTVVYGAWGLVANLALLLNVAMTMGVLTLMGATLTLPGIAGIVLGIGLAVDANVLINERIREETRNGRSAAAALKHGFDRAYSTIIDSNVTALIATVLLFSMGSGPVKGFAVTMALGILLSMFTSVSVVKAFMALWLQWRRPRQFIIGSLIPARWRGRVPTFRFMRARFVGIGVSLVLSLASVAMMVKPGLNYGVDFTGGVLIESSLPAGSGISDMRAALERLDVGGVILQQTGSGTVLTRIQQPSNADEATQTRIAESAKATLLQMDPQTRFDRVDIVGPKVSGELASVGILAVVLASLAMLVYIWIRFEWHFAVGAIATLVLDITKTMGFFALTGIEFNLTAIAAVLTLIGYSVNDKVVVYDRMRENLRLRSATPLREIIDLSINRTLARSLYTSATALLAMLPMAIWGGSTVSSFAVPMVFGIVVAASSSVFIAAPILLFLGDWRGRRPQAAKRQAEREALERLP
jgi:SecD/SecF fusion protein